MNRFLTHTFFYLALNFAATLPSYGATAAIKIIINNATTIAIDCDQSLSIRSGDLIFDKSASFLPGTALTLLAKRDHGSAAGSFICYGLSDDTSEKPTPLAKFYYHQERSSLGSVQLSSTVDILEPGYSVTTRRWLGSQDATSQVIYTLESYKNKN
ncbi:MAG: hypothetical protein ACX932_01515 [Gammaproteobacteria bacterium]